MIGKRRPAALPPWRDALADEECWFPLAYDRSDPTHAEDLDELRASGEVPFVHDTIDAQLVDLIKVRNPALNPTPEDAAQRVTAHLRGVSPADYGRWVLFPWSRRLVHLLPPAEFAEVRSDRNRNKLTKAEQAKLGRVKIALAGLSVGNAIANALALEGAFGELRMADFDHLDLSNMNRIHCAVHQIGLHKAIIAARQIFEQNPYANLVLYTDGVTAANMAEFLDGVDGSGRADIVLEECDNLYIKFKLREEARARRIPVVMETSDRGMLDIERFDLEPDRPILHGLAGDLTAEQVPLIPPQARVPLMLHILGLETMSARLAASMLEFGRTVRGISQLGSDVVLGGATTTIVVRRFALGLPLASGRLYVDVNNLLAEARAPAHAPPSKRESRRRQDLAHARQLVEAAVLAPSDGNRQPWRFEYRVRDQALRVFHDATRGGEAGDEIGRQMSLIAIGAAIENVCIAAGGLGRVAEVQLFPDPREPQLVADLRTPLQDGVAADPLVAQIGRRTTHRGPSVRPHLSPVHGQVLSSAARDSGARLQLCTTRETITELGRILGEAERIRLLSPVLQAELMRTLRWSPEEVEKTRDGIHVDTYAADPGEATVLQVIRSNQVIQLLRDVGGGSALAAPMIQALAASAAVGLLTVSGTGPEAFVRGGRAMQQVWLTAATLGLCAHPVNGFISMLARVERYQGAGLSKQEIRAVFDLREQFTRCFTVSMSDAEILLFRLSYADASPQRTLRRDVADVFTVTDDPSAPV
jgi:molybdopterin/thiamine biosynthesis adenylyltransferase/nitroreductase